VSNVIPLALTIPSLRYENVGYEDFPQEEIVMNICGTTCPENYPWLGNEMGENDYPQK